MISNKNKSPKKKSARKARPQKAIESEDETTTIHIDINLGDKTHRITLYEESDPEEVAQQFGSKHGLASKNVAKLTQ